jgi:hypothetical protein
LPPWKKRADIIKGEVAGAISIRAQLMEDVQEKERLLSIREYDLSESRRKNKVYESQLDHLQKREHDLDEQLAIVNSKITQNTKVTKLNLLFPSPLLSLPLVLHSLLFLS